MNHYYIHFLKNMIFQNKLILDIYNKEKNIEQCLYMLNEKLTHIETKLYYINIINLFNLILVFFILSKYFF
jgi:hypothetical protein